jgi:hypothetical protein
MGWKDRQILILVLSVLLWACVKDKPAKVNTPAGKAGSVYIVCEGNFGNGDATLYSYDKKSDSVYGDLYKAANGQSLGDVFQSMRRIGDSLYLCINNSDKIVVLHALTHRFAGQINIPKPRYIVPLSTDKAFVSTLYSNKVYTINPKTLFLTGEMTFPHNNPEGMCISGSNLYVCPWDTTCNKIYSTDVTSGIATQAITLTGYAPHAVLTDREQMLWVLSGNVTKGRQAVLSRVDPSTGSVVKTYTFPAGTDPIKPVFNATRDTLYFIQVKYDGTNTNNGIYRMHLHDAALPATPFISANTYQYFWALGIDPATGDIYVGDPKGFSQKGTVTIYKSDGMPIRTFTVGLGPGQFYFETQ